MTAVDLTKMSVDEALDAAADELCTKLVDVFGKAHILSTDYDEAVVLTRQWLVTNMSYCYEQVTTLRDEVDNLKQAKQDRKDQSDGSSPWERGEEEKPALY